MDAANMEVILDEHGRYTGSTVVLHLGEESFVGRGAAARFPSDPADPLIGEEIATARALRDLSRQLANRAEHVIEAREGHEVSISV